MKRLSKLNEDSLIGGMVMRNFTDEVRDEDSVNQLDSKEFFEYIKSRYEIRTEDITVKIYFNEYPARNTLSIPFRKKDYKWTYYPTLEVDFCHDVVDDIIIISGMDDCPKLMDILSSEFHFKLVGECAKINRNIKMNNKMVLDIIDAILDNVDDTILVKR